MSRRRARAWGGPAAYCAGFAVYVGLRGVPAGRDIVLAWILLGLLAFSLTDFRNRARRLVVDWLPFVLVLFAYDLLRGGSDGLIAAPHYRPQLDAERDVFGVVPTAWLQQRLWTPGHVHWWDYGSWFVYLTYFFATLVVAAILWLRAPQRFRRYVAMVALLAVMGLLTYTLFPAAPPWLAAQHGLIGPAQRLVPLIWAHVPFVSFQSLFEHGAYYSNQVAAVPSLHAAYTLLLTLFLWRYAPKPARVVLALYPPAMGFALVYLGEHYAVDILLGWIYAVVAYAAVELVAERRPLRRPAAQGAQAPA
jgi:membrane-associated phospholipid phosphatase